VTPTDDPNASIDDAPGPLPPPNDVTVKVNAHEIAQTKRKVYISVDGLEDGGGTAIVSPTQSEGIVIIADPMCVATGDGRYECALEADERDVLQFTVMVDQNSPDTTFKASVRPAPGVEDANAGNNTDKDDVHPSDAIGDGAAA
jgi:hypothetical protein